MTALQSPVYDFRHIPCITETSLILLYASSIAHSRLIRLRTRLSVSEEVQTTLTPIRV